MLTSILFGILAAYGLLVAIAGHAGRSSSVAPSMYRNTLSFRGYLVFFVCGLLAVAGYMDAR